MSRTDSRYLPTLYSFRRCPYAMRARMAIVVSGQQCVLREIVLRDKPQAMLELSPKGQVPVLAFAEPVHRRTPGVDGESTAATRVLDESLDIMFWALDKHDPQAWLAPQAGTLKDMLELIEVCDGEFKHHLDRYKYADRFPGTQSEDHRRLGSAFIKRLNARVHNQEFLFGSRVALADIAIAPFVRQFANNNREWFNEEPWPHIVKWLDQIIESELFGLIMKKYPVWGTGDRCNEEILFPDNLTGEMT